MMRSVNPISNSLAFLKPPHSNTSNAKCQKTLPRDVTHACLKTLSWQIYETGNYFQNIELYVTYFEINLAVKIFLNLMKHINEFK